MAKYIALLGLFLSFQVNADMTVTTNSNLVKSNGIYDGKIDRVIYYGPGNVGVFFKGENDVGIGVSFKGADACVGSSMASCIGCEVNIAKQTDGHFTFAVNRPASASSSASSSTSPLNNARTLEQP